MYQIVCKVRPQDDLIIIKKCNSYEEAKKCLEKLKNESHYPFIGIRCV